MAKPARSGGYLPGFDGIRAIAILMVIAWHSVVVSGFPLDNLGIARPLISFGWAGVDLFFVLSGFLITTLILQEESRWEAAGYPRRFSIGRFYIRRAFRILPVFYIVFGINTLLLSRMPDLFESVRAAQVREESALGLWPHATFWGNYFLMYFRYSFDMPVYSPGNAYTIYWSLCVEEHFYLLWPLILLTVRSEKTRIGVALGICILVCLSRFIVAYYGLEPDENIYYLSHYRIDSIMWGALGALLIKYTNIHRQFRYIAILFSSTLLAYLIFTKNISLIPGPTLIGKSIGYSLIAVTSMLLLTELYCRQNGYMARILELGPLRLTGRWSYVMYLVHFQVLNVSDHIFFSYDWSPTLENWVYYFIFTVTLVLLCSAFFHYTVEMPFLRLKKYLGRSPMPHQ